MSRTVTILSALPGSKGISISQGEPQNAALLNECFGHVCVRRGLLDSEVISHWRYLPSYQRAKWKTSNSLDQHICISSRVQWFRRFCRGQIRKNRPTLFRDTGEWSIFLALGYPSIAIHRSRLLYKMIVCFLDTLSSASSFLLVLHQSPSLVPSCPTGVLQVLRDNQISQSYQSRQLSVERPLNPPGPPKYRGRHKPHESENRPGKHANHYLLRRVVTQIDARSTDGGSTSQRQNRKEKPLQQSGLLICRIDCCSRAVVMADRWLMS